MNLFILKNGNILDEICCPNGLQLRHEMIFRPLIRAKEEDTNSKEGVVEKDSKIIIAEV